MFAVSHHTCHRSAHSDRERHDGLGCLLNPGFIVQHFRQFCVEIIEV